MKNSSTLSVTKFDVAERQLLQGIRLYFSEGDEISVHTLSEAAVQVLRDIGRPLGHVSAIRDSDRIRPEKMNEWNSILSRSRNFFKHADRDIDGVHEFNTMFNDFSLLEAVLMYHKFKKQWTPETLLFFVWFGLTHPYLLQDDLDVKKHLDAVTLNIASATNKKRWFSDALSKVRGKELTMSNVTLNYGT